MTANSAGHYSQFKASVLGRLHSNYSNNEANNTFGTPSMTVFCPESGEPNCTDAGP